MIDNGAQLTNLGMQLNNMNMINFNNANIGMNINDTIIHVIFENKGIKTVINISQNKTIKELLNLYRIKIGGDLDFFNKNGFLRNAKELNPNEIRTILDYNIKSGERIEVYQKGSLIAGYLKLKKI